MKRSNRTPGSSNEAHDAYKGLGSATAPGKRNATAVRYPGAGPIVQAVLSRYFEAQREEGPPLPPEFGEPGERLVRN